MERTIEQLDMKAVLTSQLDFLKVQSEQRRIVTRIDAPLAAYPVKADRGDMDRIFMNLISNAIKYNRDKGSVTVRITDAGSTWDVAVIDTGIGLSESEKASLFQEFFRVKNQKTAGIAGTGLGARHGEARLRRPPARRSSAAGLPSGRGYPTFRYISAQDVTP